VNNRLNITLPIVVDVDMEESQLQQSIQDSILHHESEFYERMASVCVQYDMRAELCEGSLDVESVSLGALELTEDDELVLNFTGSVEVTYDWYAHYGCKDMCGGDQVNDRWEFNAVDSEISFSLEIQQERVDEL